MVSVTAHVYVTYICLAMTPKQHVCSLLVQVLQVLRVLRTFHISLVVLTMLQQTVSLVVSIDDG